MDYTSKVMQLLPKLRMAPLVGDQDLNMNNPKWEEADFKICVCQNGDFFTKATSATVIQLTALIREAERKLGIRIFVDFAFQPDEVDTAKLRAEKMHEVFGWCSMRTLNEFDTCLCSFSIHYETMGMCTVLWGGGIPAHFWERINSKEKLPLLIAGGVVGQLLEPVFGHTKGSFVDSLFLGEGEDRFPQVVELLWKNWSLWNEGRKGKLKLLQLLTETFDNWYVPNAYTHIYGSVTPEEQKRKFDGEQLEPQPQLPENQDDSFYQQDFPGTIQKDKGNELRAITRNFPWAREKVKFHRCWNARPPMFENRLLMTTNEGAGRGELQISHGCMGFGACYFCAEGNEAGTWREYDLPAIVEAMETLKQSSAPNVISFFSLNSNYYSKVFDLYYEVAKKFNYISVIAFRADVVSAVPEYIKFLKALGTFRLTIALEGISERIRAAFLNKNLTWEQYLRTCEYCFREKFVMLKTNLIFSGHEEPEDIEEFVLAMKKMNELKTKYGARTSIVWSMTTLVTYWNTGLQWQPRRATLSEIFRDRKFKDAVRQGRDLGHRFRFNSGSEFVWQQLLVDAGRRMSDTSTVLYREYWEQNKPINSASFFDKANDAVFTDMGILDKEVREKALALQSEIQVLDDEVYVLAAGIAKDDVEGQAVLAEKRVVLEQKKQDAAPFIKAYREPFEKFFGKEYGFKEIHPSKTFDILPAYVQKMYYLAVGKRGVKYCLRTPATPEAKCKTCGFCEDDEYSKEVIVGRPITSTKTVESIEEAIFLNRAASVLRVIYQTNADPVSRHRYKIVHNHYTAAAMLRANKQLSADFRSIQNYADYVKTFHDQQDSWGGLGYFEMVLRTEPSELPAIIGPGGKNISDSVNAQLKSSKVLKIHSLPYSSNNLRSVTDLWRFTTSIPKVQLQELFSGYDGNMRVMEKGAGGLPEILPEPYAKEEFDLLMHQGERQTTGFFAISNRYNPFLAGLAFFKMKPELVREHFRFDRVGSYDMVGLPCSHCSTRPAGIDIMTNQASPLCPSCVARVRALKVAQAEAGLVKP